MKLSGESLMGKQGYGIDPERLSDYARQIKEVAEMGVQIGIVIGGGSGKNGHITFLGSSSTTNYVAAESSSNPDNDGNVSTPSSGHPLDRSLER